MACRVVESSCWSWISIVCTGKTALLVNMDRNIAPKVPVRLGTVQCYGSNGLVFGCSSRAHELGRNPDTNSHQCIVVVHASTIGHQQEGPNRWLFPHLSPWFGPGHHQGRPQRDVTWIRCHVREPGEKPTTTKISGPIWTVLARSRDAANLKLWNTWRGNRR